MNILRPVYPRADINTQQFLSEVFLTCINNAVEKITTAETKPTGAKPIHAKFQFADDACPLVQGKIHWEPQEHVWRLEFLTTQKQRAQPPGLQVDSALLGAEYASAKATAYENAKRKWNELDSSGRERIHLSGETQVKEEQEELETGAQSMSSRWSRDDGL